MRRFALPVIVLALPFLMSAGSMCPFCDAEYDVVPPERATSSLRLDCARCGSLVDVFEPDSSGRLHRPTWYLRLEKPPVAASPAKLWLWVQSYVRYVRDGRSHRAHEAWQLARETYRLRTGDCEDSAILLADWLRALGYEAYVAAGRVGSAPHAWVVLIHDGETYLLETTGSIGPRNRVPPLARLLTSYNPTEFVFDEKSVRVRRGKSWTADYTSAERWRKLSLGEQW